MELNFLYFICNKSIWNADLFQLIFKVERLFQDGETVTLNLVKEKLEDDGLLMSRSTIYRFLKEMQYRFKQFDGTLLLKETPHVIAARSK